MVQKPEKLTYGGREIVFPPTSIAWEENGETKTLESYLQTQFSNINDVLQHYNTPQAVPYESGDNRWRDLSGIGFYYAGTSNVGYPEATGILIHFRIPSSTTVTWQMFIGNAGKIWTRRVTSAGNFADATWVQV